MFAEFHARSAFSFLEGASLPEAMVARAAELGYRAIAITDRGGFYGSARAHYMAKEVGIRASVGATIPHEGNAVPVLYASREGYRRMCRDITSKNLLLAEPEAYGWDGTDHLIALTGDRDGAVGRALARDDRQAAESTVRSMMRRFGDRNVYVEAWKHEQREDGRVLRHLKDLAAHLRLPLLVSNAPLMATPKDRMLLDAFTCLRNHTALDQAGRLLAPNGQRMLRCGREAKNIFADSCRDGLVNQKRLYERLDFTLEDLGYRFPDFSDSRGQPLSIPEQCTLLRRLAYAGATKRYGKLYPKVRTQLEHELTLINRLEFPGYFLIVHDIVEFARGNGILCQGRGSAANSVVCYSLGITAVDPIGGGLLFERFLSENRRSWPDIDIDFPSGDQRERVIQYVFRKYGARGAAMTANVITYQSRSAFREMSKVLGFPESVADRFSNAPGAFRDAGSRKELPEEEYIEHKEQQRQDDFDERVSALVPPSHPRFGALKHLYHSVLAMPRHLGQHSGGMIICDRGLDQVVPIQPATMPGRTVVQWDKDDCEDLGIVKIDLLGLGMLAAMEHAIQIRARRGHPVDLAKIPKDDPAVFDLMCRADTVGTFQVESRAQMATLPIMRPRCFYDVAIEVAIIRPGPIVGDLVHPYLNRRCGREPVDYIHPACKPTLERTLGVPLFQEQVLRMAMDVAGFTGAEADELRRAMAFKRSDARMSAISEKLRARMTERGIEPEVQEKIVASIGSFALYGFPESHSISFALIAYASCWLKVHHPAEFYVGIINNQPMGFYSVNTLIQDAKRRGIRVLAVSVTEGTDETTVVDDRTIRLGLHLIKGLSVGLRERIFTARAAASFGSLEEFMRRAKPNAKERRKLAESGALNGLPEVEHRRDALWQVELPLHDDLFANRGTEKEVLLPGMSMPERLTADYATIGASAGPHTMKLWRENPGAKGVLRAKDLQILPRGFPIRIGGMAICRQRPGTAKGHCFISLEDETGIANLFVPAETFMQFRRVITTEPFLLATGRLQVGEGNQATVFVTKVEPLPGCDRTQAAKSHDFH
ncbi:error-prone DNA polymerase [Luteolibacter sp. SL250]|uniref:error-prone DNA polymerase n=1 Tax=Luteolibacter sp. SL250 TaxID=2995170 RepID=UPI002272122E|nr:error-prone DNA polymerase [Luteolibacter sp. SL250]WAC19056.1 error-prone DNA polymerase [Luteolibacter sp. SL250]